MNAKFLVVSTASAHCTQAVRAKLHGSGTTIVHRPSGKELNRELTVLARGADRVVIIAGRGLRASRLLLCTARAAIRAKRPCLYLHHANGLAGRFVLPPSCEKRCYHSGRDAAAHVEDFSTRAMPAPVVRRNESLSVFALENGPSQWNEAITASLDRANIRRIHCSDLKSRSVIRAAMEADATILLPGGRTRRWYRETSHLMRLAMGACELYGRRCLHIHHHMIPRTSEDSIIEQLNCESVVCASHKDVANVVREFIEDAKADVGLT